MVCEEYGDANYTPDKMKNIPVIQKPDGFKNLKDSKT